MAARVGLNGVTIDGQKHTQRQTQTIAPRCIAYFKIRVGCILQGGKGAACWIGGPCRSLGREIKGAHPLVCNSSAKESTFLFIGLLAGKSGVCNILHITFPIIFAFGLNSPLWGFSVDEYPSCSGERILD
jgi:hypothetical protein